MLSLSFLYENIISNNKKGQMLCHFIPFSSAQQLKKIGDPYKGLSSSIRDFHITLGFIRAESNKKKEIFNSINLLSHYIDPFSIQIEKFELFPVTENSENHDILVAIPNSENIIKIHDLCFEVFSKFRIPIDNGEYEFKPHITIKYIKPNQNIDINTLNFNQNINIDNLSYEGNGKKKTFMLGES